MDLQSETITLSIQRPCIIWSTSIIGLYGVHILITPSQSLSTPSQESAETPGFTVASVSLQSTPLPYPSPSSSKRSPQSVQSVPKAQWSLSEAFHHHHMYHHWRYQNHHRLRCSQLRQHQSNLGRYHHWGSQYLDYRGISVVTIHNE